MCISLIFFQAIADRLLEVATVELDEEMGADIKSIFKDKAVQEAFNLYTSFHLLDSAK